MKGRTALLELFKDSGVWRAFYRSCCDTSAFRLRSQAWLFCDELKDRGHKLQAEEVEDSLLSLARDLLPDTPAAQWDAEWVHDLCRDALARLAKAYAGLSANEKDTVDLSAQEVWDEQMHEAGLANDPLAFQVALGGWTRAGLQAMEQLRIRGGAA
jgi:hypothetical protein